MDDFTFNSETGMPTIGDIVPDGATIVWEDSPERLVLLVRDGENIKVITQSRTVAALMERNACEASEFNATGSLPTMSKVASIPIDLYYLMQATGQTEDPVAMARMLNDIDYRKFRTNTLRV